MNNMDKSIIQVSTQVVNDSSVLLKLSNDSIILERVIFTGKKSLSFSNDPEFSDYLDSFLTKQSSDLSLKHNIRSALSSVSTEIPFKKDSHVDLEPRELEKIYKKDLEDFENRTNILQESLLDIIEEFQEEKGLN